MFSRLCTKIAQAVKGTPRRNKPGSKASGKAKRASADNGEDTPSNPSATSTPAKTPKKRKVAAADANDTPTKRVRFGQTMEPKIEKVEGFINVSEGTDGKLRSFLATFRMAF